MDIELTEEQQLLGNSVERLLNERYGFDERRRIIASDDGLSRDRWREFAELGFLAAPFSEEAGGMGAGPLATMILMEAFGRHLVVEPFLETIVLCGGLIEALGSAPQRREHLSRFMSGAEIWALATVEAHSRHDLHAVNTTADRKGDGYLLRGAKAVVVGAPWADRLIVSARTSAGPRDRDGVSLFIVDRQSPNLHLQGFKTLDGRRAAEATLDGVWVADERLLGREGAAVPALERCSERAIAAQCAEALGAMSELNRATLDHIKTRKQFGVPLGSFQALQHRMVDMFIALEEATAITYALNASLTRDGHGLSRLVSAAKAKVGEAGRFVGEQAVQLHGGMGMTEELIVGHYLKRLIAINIQFGDPAFHTLRIARDVMHASPADPGMRAAPPVPRPSIANVA